MRKVKNASSPSAAPWQRKTKEPAEETMKFLELPTELLTFVVKKLCPRDNMRDWRDACLLAQTCVVMRIVVVAMPTFKRCGSGRIDALTTKETDAGTGQGQHGFDVRARFGFISAPTTFPKTYALQENLVQAALFVERDGLKPTWKMLVSSKSTSNTIFETTELTHYLFTLKTTDVLKVFANPPGSEMADAIQAEILQTLADPSDQHASAAVRAYLKSPKSYPPKSQNLLLEESWQAPFAIIEPVKTELCFFKQTFDNRSKRFVESDSFGPLTMQEEQCDIVALRISCAVNSMHRERPEGGEGGEASGAKIWLLQDLEINFMYASWSVALDRATYGFDPGGRFGRGVVFPKGAREAAGWNDEMRR